MRAPLERELLAGDSAESLAITDVAREQFEQWTAMRLLVLQHVGREGRRHAELVNRYRRAKQLHEGDSVLVSDPRLTKERAGRTPWRRPLGGHGRVIAVRGSKVDIKGHDGILLKDVHQDCAVLVPEEIDDCEARPPLSLSPRATTRFAPPDR